MVRRIRESYTFTDDGAVVVKNEATGEVRQREIVPNLFQAGRTLTDVRRDTKQSMSRFVRGMR